MNDLTPLPASSELKGKSTLAGFRFEREELAFYQKHVWNVWTPEQQRLAERLRTAIADLSMNPALEVTYDVDYSRSHTEVLTISSGEDRDIFMATITDRRFVGGKPYTRMQDMPPVISAFELTNAGKKYGDHGDVDFETISYKLRQVMLDFRYGTVYTTAWVEKETNHGTVEALQLVFRLQSSGLGPDSGADPDFHIVLEVKNARVVDVAE
jgi:hypothetical protein